MTNNLEELLESDVNFISKIRFLDGFDEDKLKELIVALDLVRQELRDKESVQKKLVGLLIDVVPSLISSSYSYQGADREKINKAIDEISESIRLIFT